MQFLFQMPKIKANIEIWNDYNVLRPGKHFNLIFRVIGPVFFDGGGGRAASYSCSGSGGLLNRRHRWRKAFLLELHLVVLWWRPIPDVSS